MRYSGVQSYEVQARGLSPLLIKILAYLTFMNTAILTIHCSELAVTLLRKREI
jgi:hypothetical protein